MRAGSSPAFRTKPRKSKVVGIILRPFCCACRVRLTRKFLRLIGASFGGKSVVKRRTSIQNEITKQQNNLSWEVAVEQFLESLKIKGLAFHTRRWHKENLQAIVKVLRLKGYPSEPNLITEAMLKDIILEMVDAPLSPTTINHRIRSTKQFYHYLLSEDLVTYDPSERLDRKKAPLSIIETFSEEDLERLLSVPDKTRFVGLRDYAIILFLLDTGVRLSELVGIKLVDIKMVDCEVIITMGKGGKHRRVFMSPKTKATLQKYLQARGDILDNPYLFVNSENLPMKGRNVQERLTLYGKKAKILGVRVSPHTFRHTFAKMYILRGGDPFSLQSLLGHSTLDMVRHYVNLWGNDLQKMHRQYSPVTHLLST